jgi:hypothetical protein
MDRVARERRQNSFWFFLFNWWLLTFNNLRDNLRLHLLGVVLFTSFELLGVLWV